MRKLAFGALFVGLLAACGGSSSGGKKSVVLVDGASGDSGQVCNVLTQTGCMTGEKCTWIIDTSDANGSVGHIGCAPENGGTGTPVADGASCTRNPPGATGYDNCVKGDYCFGPSAGGTGTCKMICDPSGGAPMCSTGFACGTYEGLLESGGTAIAGVCDPTCNPLADNNFLGATGNNRTGTACGSDGSASGSGFIYNKGCYGYPNGRFGKTQWTCSGQVAPSRFHRTACDTTVHTGDRFSCANSSGNPYLNGCASGYEPIFIDSEGSSQTDCIAMCAPATCYNAGTGTTSNPMCGTADANAAGNNGSGHACKNTNVQSVTFTNTTATVNGEQCFYSWLFEFDANGAFVMSDTSDTVGFCFDHSKYKYDPTGGSNNNTVVMACYNWGLGSNGYNVGSSGLDATSWGCVDTATARAAGDLMFDGKANFKRQTQFRLPYNRAARQPF